MSRKKFSAQRNPKTGSYTVRVPKSTVTGTGKFVSEERKPAHIVVVGRDERHGLPYVRRLIFCQ